MSIVWNRRSRLTSAALLAVALALGGCSSRAVKDEPSTQRTIPLPECFDADAATLPFSICLPSGWELGDVVHSDGSVDVIVGSGANDDVVGGFGKLYGPVDPGREVHQYLACDEFMANPLGLGQEFQLEHPRTDSITVDGRTGCEFSSEVAGRSQSPEGGRMYVLDARVPLSGGAGVELLFVWHGTGLSIETVRAVVGSIRFDDTLIEQQLDTT